MQSQVSISNSLNKEEKRFVINHISKVRKALLMKHGSLTKAAEELDVDYINLSQVVNGRLRLIHIVSAIQDDLGLTDSQVLEFWPLLRTWPRESRRAV